MEVTTKSLRIREQPSDRPDLVARVFKLILKALLGDATAKNICGRSIAHVYSIEFQKRGFPHIYVLKAEDKFRRADIIKLLSLRFHHLASIHIYIKW